MKPQDILFIIIFALIVYFFRKKPAVVVSAGLACILLAIPLFQFWIFFTAERLIYYASAFLLAGILLFSFQNRK